MFTVLVLDGWGLGAMTGVAELLVSELATNVIRAAAGPDGQPCYDSDGKLPSCGCAS